eukprot:GSChrysophyteH1.ASY1.ANO1.1495.1 assembled CDS
MTRLSRFSLSQGLNIPALRSSISIFRDPTLILPHESLKHVSDIQFDKLQSLGIKYLVFDKDNTLTKAFEDNLDDTVKSTIDQAKHVFPDCIAILSNSVGSNDDLNFAGAAAVEEVLELPVIRHKLKKPACFDEVRQHFASVRKVASESIDASEICMVGDRSLTDVVFANTHGMYSIHVEPLNASADHPVPRVVRTVESRVLVPFVKFLGYDR